MSKITQMGKTSHKLPAINPILSPKSFATPSMATCLWLNPMALFITGDMLPNKYPIPAHDWIHIAHTNTSHLLLMKALNLSCIRRILSYTICVQRGSILHIAQFGGKDWRAFEGEGCVRWQIKMSNHTTCGKTIIIWPTKSLYNHTRWCISYIRRLLAMYDFSTTYRQTGFSSDIASMPLSPPALNLNTTCHIYLCELENYHHTKANLVNMPSLSLWFSQSRRFM